MTTATIDRHQPTALAETRGPYAPVPFCGDHRTYAKGCQNCRRYFTWRKRVWSRKVEAGERTTVPFNQVRAHLDQLAAAGMTPKMIQAAGSVHRSTLAGLLYKPARRNVAVQVADKILAIPVPAQPATPPPRSHITDPTGTLRRVQALARIGWTYRHISAAAQTSHRLEHYAVQNSVTHETAAAIARAYDLLSMTPGPSSRVASRAAKFGWAPPLAWDDDTIDDPAAQPNHGGTHRSDDYDPTTVAQAVEGRLTYAQVAVHRPDLIETVRRLARTLTDVEISHLLRWPGVNDARPSGSTRAINAITKLRLDNGIPAHRRPAVVPHRQHRRKNKAA